MKLPLKITVEFNTDNSPWNQGNHQTFGHLRSTVTIRPGQYKQINHPGLLIPNILRNSARCFSSDAVSHPYQQEQMGRLLDEFLAKCDLAVARATSKDSRLVVQRKCLAKNPEVAARL